MAFHIMGRVSAGMRSRQRAGEEEVRIPNYQGHPGMLMFQEDHMYRWYLVDMIEIRKFLSRLLGARDYLRRYPNAGAGLSAIWAATHRRMEHEYDCDQFVDWLHEEGEQHGVRPPTAKEIASAAGIEAYCDALGLTGRRLYDAVGLSFDGYALMRRVGASLRDWTGDPA